MYGEGRKSIFHLLVIFLNLCLYMSVYIFWEREEQAFLVCRLMLGTVNHGRQFSVVQLPWSAKLPIQICLKSCQCFKVHALWPQKKSYFPVKVRVTVYMLIQEKWKKKSLQVKVLKFAPIQTWKWIIEDQMPKCNSKIYFSTLCKSNLYLLKVQLKYLWHCWVVWGHSAVLVWKQTSERFQVRTTIS